MSRHVAGRGRAGTHGADRPAASVFTVNQVSDVVGVVIGFIALIVTGFGIWLAHVDADRTILATDSESAPTATPSPADSASPSEAGRGGPVALEDAKPGVKAFVWNGKVYRLEGPRIPTARVETGLGPGVDDTVSQEPSPTPEGPGLPEVHEGGRQLLWDWYPYRLDETARPAAAASEPDLANRGDAHALNARALAGYLLALSLVVGLAVAARWTTYRVLRR